MENEQFKAFTIRYKRHVPILECYVDLLAVDGREKTKALAFVDTGAMISAVSSSLAEILGAEEVNSIRMRGFTGVELVPQHILDVELPNGILIETLIVAQSKYLGESHSGEEYGFLIGMDILKYGDFVLNHSEGYTSFSFRVPSMEHVDFNNW